jgi:WD40 repeat protein
MRLSLRWITTYAAVAVAMLILGPDLTWGQDARKTDRYGDPLPPGAVSRLGTVRLRHLNHIEYVALSPDARLVATGSSDALTRIWDTKTGRKVLEVTHDRAGSPLLDAAFSPDGRRLAVAATYLILDTRFPATCIYSARFQDWASLELCDVKTAARTTLASGDGTSFNSVAFSPDGRLVAAGGSKANALGSAAATISVWNAAGKLLWRRDGNWIATTRVAFSPDGKLVAGGCWDGRIRLWDSDTGEIRVTIAAAEQGLQSVSLSPDAKRLAAVSQDAKSFKWFRGTLQLWDLAENRELLRKEGNFRSVAFSPDDDSFLTSSWADDTVVVWDTATMNEQRSIATGAGVFSLSADGKLLASGGISGAIRLWDPSTAIERSVPAGHTDAVDSVAISPDGSTTATSSRDLTVRLWDSNTGEPTAQLAHLENPRKVLRNLNGQALDGFYCAVFSPDGQRLLLGATDDTVRLWSLAEKREEQVLEAVAGTPILLAVSPDGERIAAGWDAIDVWDLASKRHREFRASSDEARAADLALQFSPGGKLLAATGRASDALYLRRGEEPPELFLPTRRVRYGYHTAAFRPDGNALACSVYLEGAAQEVILLEVDSGRQLREFEQPQSAVQCITFSRDGKLLAAGDEQGTVYLWDVATSRRLATIPAHPSAVRAVSFTPDASRLVSGSDDKTAIVWDVATLLRVWGAKPEAHARGNAKEKVP